jgi:hypothetical protein
MFAKYKITQKGEFFYLYYKRFYIFWFLYDVYGCLYNAEKQMNFLLQKEILIKEI